MDGETLQRLSILGSLAGRSLVGDNLLGYSGFNMSEHRWRRFLVTQAKTRQHVNNISVAWQDGQDPLGTFIRDYAVVKGRSYAKTSTDHVSRVADMVDGLSALNAQWVAKPPTRELDVPKPDCVMRITPNE